MTRAGAVNTIRHALADRARIHAIAPTSRSVARIAVQRRLRPYRDMPAHRMSDGTRLLGWAVALAAAAVALDFFGVVVAALLVSERSMQAAESAAVVLLGFEAVVGLAATAAFWRLANVLASAARILATLGVLLLQSASFLAMALFSLLALNR